MAADKDMIAFTPFAGSQLEVEIEPTLIAKTALVFCVFNGWSGKKIESMTCFQILHQIDTDDVLWNELKVFQKPVGIIVDSKFI